MVDLAMHMMDIVQNSIRACSEKIIIEFVENSSENSLSFSVEDNGSGMDNAMLKNVTDAFCTSRKTRRVGLGIPFLKMTAEQTGGYFEIDSKLGVGTTVKSIYKTDNVDCLPLGDIAGYLMLILIANPKTHIVFSYVLDRQRFDLDTEDLKEQGISDLSDLSMYEAVKEYISENLLEIFKLRSRKSLLC